MATRDWTLRWFAVQVLALLVLVGVASLLGAIAPGLSRSVKLGIDFAVLVLLSIGLFRVRGRLFGEPPAETTEPTSPERSER